MIGITERVRPIVSLASLMEGRGTPVHGPTSLTNEEGEHGAFVSLHDGPLQRDIGVLVGDEFLATVVGVTILPLHYDRSRREVEALTRRLPLLLGIRRRLFHYSAPIGWHPVSRGLEVEYYAPEYPRDRSRLTVFPALPSSGFSATDALEALVADCGIAQSEWGESLRNTNNKLAFSCARATSGDRHVSLAAAADDSYLYALRLETENKHEAVWDSTLESVVPISVTAGPVLTALAHWAE